MFMNWSWWSHQMETFSALLVHTPVTGEFPLQKAVTRIFDVFFDLRPNKRSSEESWGWWFGTPLRSLWRYCNVNRSTDRYGSSLFQKWSSYMVWAPNCQSLWPSGVIWRHTPLWTLFQVIIWTDVDLWSVSVHDIHLSAISTINH